jgi:murein DD-endopeptidase MepM/ murein hydrolase activator NlpD
MKKIKKIKKIMLVITAIAVIGFLIPENFDNPVEGANRNSYNQESFWYYPWGKSVTHKGVDIFARRGTSVHSSTYGIVLITSQEEVAGNYVVVLGPKWRLHCYLHLDTILTKPLRGVGHKTLIGKVGDTGNAKGKPCHLHYGIATVIPYPWRIDHDRQAWKKMFFLNPIEYLNKVE